MQGEVHDVRGSLSIKTDALHRTAEDEGVHAYAVCVCIEATIVFKGPLLVTIFFLTIRPHLLWDPQPSKYHHEMGTEHSKCEPVGGVLNPNTNKTQMQGYYKAQQTDTESKSYSHIHWVLLIKLYCTMALSIGK